MKATTYFTDNGTVNQLCAIVLKDSKGRTQRTITAGSISGMLEVLARLGDTVSSITYGGKRCPEFEGFYA